MGNPLNVRVGPGKLYIADLGSPEPTDLATAWDVAWAELGYTNEGSAMAYNATYENVNVAEELDPVLILQTAREITLSFDLAEITALNLQRAMNGGTITTPTALVVFEPPAVGDYVYVMLGWESDDGLERSIYRKALQVGSIDMGRRKAPTNALIQTSWRCVKPPGAAPMFHIQDANMVESS